MPYIIVLVFVFFYSGRAQSENGLVNWVSFKEAQEKNKIQQKPFIIDIYTDWCGWCKRMMQTTYSNPTIAQYINTNFYPVKFNAETKDTIEFNGKIYKPLSKDPKTPHELAIKFLGQSLSYPSTFFVTNNFEYNLLSQGYMEEKRIEPLLVFMVENVWRSASFDDFNLKFSQTFYNDSLASKAKINIVSIKEVEQLNKKKRKKVLVNITSNFCNSCKVQEKTTFNDTSIAKIINNYFYFINFNAETNDTIIFKGQRYYKTLVNNYPLHNLLLKLTNNRYGFPALCVLDEDLNTIEAINFYQHPKQLKIILEYFYTNEYKKTTWNEFLKNRTIIKENKKK
ncbi:MAG: DUF255 domain-containing protein [Bacteroidetes bacterium]|nr:DUF255 domain-containing protein [Bacteroidota bacterium]